MAMVKAGVGHHLDEEEHEVFPARREKAPARLAELGDPRPPGGGGSVRRRPGTTREELYERVEEAGVPGRSTLSEAELEAAPDG